MPELPLASILHSLEACEPWQHTFSDDPVPPASIPAAILKPLEAFLRAWTAETYIDLLRRL